ncbi:MAG: selenide, water dikinase SelD [candidate division Zixibacteria bacterium]|nr:selenide, water dikinase SelD [candidate division Zixibacteria bacterium]
MIQVLDRLPKKKYDNVLVGTEFFDDAGVVKYDDKYGLVTTVDYFTPVVDEPRDFGRIAAANSLSDIYAMGATPISALNIVGFPEKKLPLEILGEILSGGAEITSQCDVPIVGGHSVKNDEPFYGLSVTGKVEIEKMMTNSACQPGDYLYLTKPLGSGLITTGLKGGKVSDDIVARAVEIMSALNKDASEAALEAGAKAATDVTGYGFLGHLLEMMMSSGLSAEVYYEPVPLMDGVLELAEKQTFPGGTGANLIYVEKNAVWDDKLSLDEKRILCDAQTSGGLIISIAPDKHKQLENELIRRNQIVARVGEIVEKEEWYLKINKN